MMPDMNPNLTNYLHIVSKMDTFICANKNQE